jgi:hypothetical protein
MVTHHFLDGAIRAQESNMRYPLLEPQEKLGSLSNLACVFFQALSFCIATKPAP